MSVDFMLTEHGVMGVGGKGGSYVGVCVVVHFCARSLEGVTMFYAGGLSQHIFRGPAAIT